MFKKLLLTVAITLSLMGIAEAKEPHVYVVNSGSPTGTFNAIQQAYAKDLQEYYVDVEFIHARGCAKATQITERLPGVTWVIWEGVQTALYRDGKNPACYMSLDEESFVRADLKYNRITVLSTSSLTLQDLLAPNKTWKVGHDVPKAAWDSFVADLNKAINSNLVSVTYESSGTSALGLLTGEIDFLITNTKQVNKYSNEMRSVTTLNPSGEGTVPALSSQVQFKLVDAGRSEILMIKNATAEEATYLENAVREIAADTNSNISKWYATSGFVDSLTLSDELAYSTAMQLIEIWRE